MTTTGFLSTPEHSPEAQAQFDEDQEELGYVMNATKLWAYQPETLAALFDLMRQAISGANFSLRQRGVLVTATAATRQDSYCSLAWGAKLSKFADPDLAAAVIRGDDDVLSEDEKALADWARKLVRDPNGTTGADMELLHAAGFDDTQIFAMSVFVALRLAFSSINDALGAVPDPELRSSAPTQVASAVSFGRS
ncbi:MAG TPA: hypothetical protein VGO03_13165 [Acidimicrobiia bacterium]|jgi:uncharacterized peroxidase-related enzyme